MSRKIILTILFFVSLSILILNSLAGEYFWYWKFWWFDMLMHFLGGLMISFFVVYFYKLKMIKKDKLIYAIFFATMIVAVLWEIFEVSIGLSIYEQNYFFDTIVDLFMAILASAIVYKFFITERRIL